MKSVVLLFRQPRWIKEEFLKDSPTAEDEETGAHLPDINELEDFSGNCMSPEDEEMVAHMKDLAELIKLSGGSATILSPKTFLAHSPEEREKIRLILIGPHCEESIIAARDYPQTRVLCPPETSDTVIGKGLKPFEGIRFRPSCFLSGS